MTCSAAARAGNLPGQAAKRLVILLFSETQRRRAECFRIICRGKIPIIHQYKLIHNDMRNVLQLRHEARMNTHSESLLWILPSRHRVRHFAGLQRRCVKCDFARVSHERAIFQNPDQFLPSDLRSVFFEYFSTLCSHMGVKGLSGVFRRQLRGHSLYELAVAISSEVGLSAESVEVEVFSNLSGRPSFAFESRPCKIGTDMRRNIV